MGQSEQEEGELSEEVAAQVDFDQSSERAPVVSDHRAVGEGVVLAEEDAQSRQLQNLLPDHLKAIVADVEVLEVLELHEVGAEAWTLCARCCRRRCSQRARSLQTSVEKSSQKLVFEWTN